MKKIGNAIVLSLCFAVSAVSVAAAEVLPDDSAGGWTFVDGDRVVFLGDSITHHGRYLEQIALYYATRFPDRNIWFSGSGESGGTAGRRSVMRRFEEDVVAKKPTVVTVMFGMNDVRRNSWSRRKWAAGAASRAAAFRSYTNDMTRLVREIRARAGNPRVVRLTPSPYDQTCLIRGRGSDCVCNDGLAVFAEWLRAEAARESAPCVDLQTFLRGLNAREQAKDPGWSFMRGGGSEAFDRVHPKEFGYLFFTYAFLRAQRAPAEVSTIVLDAGKGRVVGAGNADVSRLSVEEGSVSFTAKEKALPYPLEGPCLAAAAYVPFVSDLNRQMLTVKGLRDGGWILSVDGEDVGRWTAGELAAGVNLAVCRKTPQYRQALEVKRLNGEMWKRDTCVRDVKMWRLWKKKSLPVDDPAAIRAWYARKYPKGPKDWFGHMAKTYVDNMEKVEKLWAEAEALKGTVRAAAAPVSRAWRLRRDK